MTELWIRTQDKNRLIMVTGVEFEIIDGTSYGLIGYTINNLPVELGRCYSKDFAMEILDQIQDQLSSYCVYEKENKKEVALSNGAMVYEMPESDFGLAI